MTSIVPRKRAALAIIVTTVFAVVFLPVTYLVDGGEIFGGLIVIPLALIAWNWGYRKGIIAATIGAVSAETVFAVEYFLIRHRPLTLYWLIGTLVGVFVIPFIATVVGKLSEALHQKETAESALRESEEHFREIFMNAPFGYFRSTPDGKAITTNPTFAKMLGYNSLEEAIEEVNSKGIAEGLYANPAQRLMIVAEALQTNQWQRHEVLFRRRDGTSFAANLILRSNLRSAMGSVELEGFVEDISMRKKAEESAVESHQHLEALLSALPDVMFEIDRHGRFYACRALNTSHFFVDPDQCVGRMLREVLPENAAGSIMEALAAAASTGKHVGGTYSLSMKNRTAYFELSLAAIGDVRNPDCHFVALSRDVTDRKGLERQLVQSQKMEAVGRLAGGVAHDFNNIIMVILGFCDIIEGHPENRKKVLEEVAVIRDSANRAASLTSQLLAFSRKQLLQPKAFDLFTLIQRMEKMLARSLGEDIALSVVAPGEPSTVKADEGQLQQVIMNLALNSRDAMPQGGRLTIGVENVHFAEDDPQRRPEVIPGQYVLLSVSDDGTGMSQETVSHLFEPFFTTKELGKGTGLGLSIVYGIVKQSEGYVYVESKVEEGTTFRIYLPKAQEEIRGAAVVSQEPPQERGSETVLLVEDDESVRRLIKQSLEAHGYVVLEASSGAEALRLCEEKPGRIHLLLTDVVMLGIGGRQVAEGFRRLNADAPVILMTGYAERESLGGANETFDLLIKPIGTRDLLERVRQALARRRKQTL